MREVAGVKVLNFSLRTEMVYKNASGSPVIETTWHQVVVWQHVTKVDVESISKGDTVRVTGRLRTNSYRSDLGESKVMVEVLANSLEMVESI